jgi:hypothetical protein
MTDLPAAEFWHHAARRTARRLNLAWWIQSFAPLLVVVGALSFGLIFWLRSQQAVLDPALTAAACGLAVLAAAAFAWHLARRRFIPDHAALVTLESRLHLHNALSTAEAGHAPWPPPRPLAPDDGFRWSWRWIGGPAAAATAFWLGAFLLPVPADLEAAPPPMTPPLAWPEMQNWLEKLEEQAVIEPAQLDQLKEKLSELQAQSEKEWYSHESLEATDSLRQSLDRSIQQMGSELDTAERSLNALQNYSDQLTAESKDQLAADFQAALQGLRASELKLDPELMKKLAALDPKNLKSLSKEQLDQMREAMKKNAAACKACQNPGDGKSPGFLGDGQGSDDEEMAALMKLLAGQGTEPGRGGITRGPGAAPLFLGDTESKLGTNNQEAVTNDDLTRAAPADVIGLGEQEHELDKASVAPRTGGAADTGQGGERVWKDDLTPAERAVLKRYFK